MQYDEASFKNLLFNPLNKKDMLKAYPILNDIIPQTENNPDESFLKHPLLDKIIRYVIMTCDPKSALIYGENDINYRKALALDLSGLDKEKESTKTAILNNDLIDDIDIVLTLTCNYLVRFAKSREFAAIIATEFKYNESIREILTPIKGETNAERLDAAKKKSVISDEIDKDIKRIEGYYKAFYGNDEQLVKKATSRKRPEDYAK